MPTKPDPHPVLHICKQWDVKPCNTVMVGDHLHDIQCGTEAGAGMYREILQYVHNTFMHSPNKIKNGHMDLVPQT